MGYISVWARVRSTRVPNIIHHDMREEGVKLIKTSGIDPLRYCTELQFTVPLESVERSRPGVIICVDKMRYRIKMLSEK